MSNKDKDCKLTPHYRYIRDNTMYSVELEILPYLEYFLLSKANMECVSSVFCISKDVSLLNFLNYTQTPTVQ